MLSNLLMMGISFKQSCGLVMLSVPVIISFTYCFYSKCFDLWNNMNLFILGIEVVKWIEFIVRLNHMLSYILYKAIIWSLVILFAVVDVKFQWLFSQLYSYANGGRGWERQGEECGLCIVMDFLKLVCGKNFRSEKTRLNQGQTRSKSGLTQVRSKCKTGLVLS